MDYENVAAKKVDEINESLSKKRMDIIKRLGFTNKIPFKDYKKALYKVNNNELNLEHNLTQNNKKNWKKQVNNRIEDARGRGYRIYENPTSDDASCNNYYKLIEIGGKYKNNHLVKLHEIGHSEGDNLPYDTFAQKIAEETRADQNIIEGIKNNLDINNNSKKQMIKSAEEFKKGQVNNNYKIRHYLLCHSTKQ